MLEVSKMTVALEEYSWVEQGLNKDPI